MRRPAASFFEATPLGGLKASPAPYGARPKNLESSACGARRGVRASERRAELCLSKVKIWLVIWCSYIFQSHFREATPLAGLPPEPAGRAPGFLKTN